MTNDTKAGLDLLLGRTKKKDGSEGHEAPKREERSSDEVVASDGPEIKTPEELGTGEAPLVIFDFNDPEFQAAYFHDV